MGDAMDSKVNDDMVVSNDEEQLVAAGAQADSVADGAGASPDALASDAAGPGATDEAQPEGPTSEELARIHERNAFIRAADRALTDVRQRSYEGKLTTTARWRKQAFAPEGMSQRAFEEELTTYIEDREHAEPKPVVGRIAAPKPLEVELKGTELTEDDPLSELDVRDIAFLHGKKGTYLYSVALLSHSFAKALFHTAEDNDVSTFVDVVRTESSVYPRPVCIDSFMNPPYLWPRSRTRKVFEKVQTAGSFKDIHEVKASNGVSYYYSDLYLSEAQAKSLAEWAAVERQRNP